MKSTLILAALCLVESVIAKGQTLGGVQLGSEETHHEKFEEHGVEQKQIDNIENMQKKLDDYTLLQKKIDQDKEYAPQTTFEETGYLHKSDIKERH